MNAGGSVNRSLTMKSFFRICVISTVLALGISTPYNHPRHSRFYREHWGRSQPEVQDQFYPPPVYEWPTRNYHQISAPAYSEPEVTYPQTQSYHHKTFTSAPNLDGAANHRAQEVNNYPVNYQTQERVNHYPLKYLVQEEEKHSLSHSPSQGVNGSPVQYLAQEAVNNSPAKYPARGLKKSPAKFRAQERVNHDPLKYIAQEDENQLPSNTPYQEMNDSPENYPAQGEDQSPVTYLAQDEVKNHPVKHFADERENHSSVKHLAQEGVKYSPINSLPQTVNESPDKYLDQEGENPLPIIYLAEEDVAEELDSHPSINSPAQRVNDSPRNLPAQANHFPIISPAQEVNNSPLNYQFQEGSNRPQVKYLAQKGLKHSPVILAQEEVNHSPLQYLAQKRLMHTPAHYLTQKRVKHTPLNHHAHNNVNLSPIIIKKVSVPMVEGGAKYIFSENGPLTNFRIIRWNTSDGLYDNEDYLRVAVKEALVSRGFWTDNNDETEFQRKTLATPDNIETVATVLADSDENIEMERYSIPKPWNGEPQHEISNVSTKPAKFNSVHPIHKVHKHSVKALKDPTVVPTPVHKHLSTTAVIAKSDNPKVVAIGDNVKAISSSDKNDVVSVASSDQNQPIVSPDSVKSQASDKPTPTPVEKTSAPNKHSPVDVKDKPVPFKSTRAPVKHTPMPVKPTPATVKSTLIPVQHKQLDKYIPALFEHSMAKNLAHRHSKISMSDDSTVTSLGTESIAADDIDKTNADNPNDVLLAPKSAKSVPTADVPTELDPKVPVVNTKEKTPLNKKKPTNDNGDYKHSNPLKLVDDDNFSQSDENSSTQKEPNLVLSSQKKFTNDAKPDSAFTKSVILATAKPSDATGKNVPEKVEGNLNIGKNDSAYKNQDAVESFRKDKVPRNIADKSVETVSDKDIASTDKVTDTYEHEYVYDDAAFSDTSDEQYDTAESESEESDATCCTHAKNSDINPAELMTIDDATEDRSGEDVLKTDIISLATNKNDKNHVVVKQEETKNVHKLENPNRRNEKPDNKHNKTDSEETDETNIDAKNTNLSNIDVKSADATAIDEAKEDRSGEDVSKPVKILSVKDKQHKINANEKPDNKHNKTDSEETDETNIDDKNTNLSNIDVKSADAMAIDEAKEDKSREDVSKPVKILSIKDKQHKINANDKPDKKHNKTDSEETDETSIDDKNTYLSNIDLKSADSMAMDETKEDRSGEDVKDNQHKKNTIEKLDKTYSEETEETSIDDTNTNLSNIDVTLDNDEKSNSKYEKSESIHKKTVSAGTVTTNTNATNNDVKPADSAVNEGLKKERSVREVSKTDKTSLVQDNHYIEKEPKTVDKFEKPDTKNDKTDTKHKKTDTVAAHEADDKQAASDEDVDPTKAERKPEAKFINSEEVIFVTNEDIARISSENDNDEPLTTVSFLAGLIGNTLKEDGSLQKWFAEPKIQAFVKKMFPILS